MTRIVIQEGSGANMGLAGVATANTKVGPPCRCCHHNPREMGASTSGDTAGRPSFRAFDLDIRLSRSL